MSRSGTAHQLQRVGGDAAHQQRMEGADGVQVLGRGDAHRLDPGGLEILAMLDHLRAPGAHGGVLLDRVAVRDPDLDRNAVAAGREGDRLAVVAARGRGDPRRPAAPPEIVEVDQPPAQLEGARGGVVLVLQPDLGPRPRAQQRPGVLRGRGHHGVHQFRRRLELRKVEQGHGDILDHDLRAEPSQPRRPAPETGGPPARLPLPGPRREGPRTGPAGGPTVTL